MHPPSVRVRPALYASRRRYAARSKSSARRAHWASAVGLYGWDHRVHCGCGARTSAARWRRLTWPRSGVHRRQPNRAMTSRSEVWEPDA